MCALYWFPPSLRIQIATTTAVALSLCRVLLLLKEAEDESQRLEEQAAADDEEEHVCRGLGC